MNKLEELLKETDYTTEEWQTHQKVEKHCQLCDLEYLLDEMLQENDISQEEYEQLCKNAHVVIEKYNKWLDYEWRETMIDAINYVLEWRN